jgi:nucleoside-diphosphate-sugar epimerase
MGTRNVAEAAADAGVKRLVHVSSIAVYGLLVRGRVTEDHPLSAGGSIAYNVTKADGERMLLDVAARRGLDYSIIRPGMIYGPKSEPWTLRMFRLARRSPLVFIGDGSGSAHPIHVDDVVALTVLLATHPAASGEAFNCSADPAPTFREFLGGYMRLAGHERWLGIPRLPALLLASLIARFAPKASMVRDAPDALRLFTKPGVIYSTEKARRLLGWQPKIELAEGIAGTASYLREKGLLQ